MATADDVLAQMDEDGIDLSVVFGFPFADQGLCREVNDYVLEEVVRGIRGGWPGWPVWRPAGPAPWRSWSAAWTPGCAAAASWRRSRGWRCEAVRRRRRRP